MNSSNTHKRRSIRLKEYDYSSPGEYFVTICTYMKQCTFGKIVEENINLSSLGEIAVQCWKEIPRHFSNVKLDAFVCMPNHIHGIIILIENDNSVGIWHDGHIIRSSCNLVGTRHAVSLHEQFGKPTKNSVSTIVRLYESIVTKRIHEFNNTNNVLYGSPVFTNISFVQKKT